MPDFKAEVVVLNPKARGGRGEKLWQRFLTTDEGKKFEALPTFNHVGESPLNEALEMWLKPLLLSGKRAFVAAGGDGTVNLTLNALLKSASSLGIPSRELSLGAVGLGSSNDFHKPKLRLGRSLVGPFPCRLDFKNSTPHDIGEVNYVAHQGREKKFFIVNASLGVTAEANLVFNRAHGFLKFLKRLWPDAAILAVSLKTFSSFKNFAVQLRSGEQQRKNITISNLGVVKNHHFAGSFRYDKETLCNSGTFGLHVAHNMSKPQMLRTLISLSFGNFSSLPQTLSTEAKEIDVLSQKPFALEFDGEVVETNEVRFQVLPSEICICP